MKLELNILKMDEDKRISVVVYSKDDKVIRRHYLSNKNKYRQGYENTLTFDLKTDYKIAFSYKKLVSLPIQLSKSLPSLKVRINKRYNSFTIDYYVKGINKTGEVYQKTFKSDLLSYRRGSKINTFIYKQPNKEGKPYKLLIAFDGQNLFSINGVGKYTTKNDPYGSWQVDKILTKVSLDTNNPYLVLSIDNANYYRDKDLTMSQEFGKVDKRFAFNKKFMNGKLENLCKVIVNDMIPYLKENYDIDWSDVGTFGSSSGGLACFYLGLNYSDMFSYILSFSPALFFFTPNDLNKLIIGKDKLPTLVLTGGYVSQLEKLLTDFNEYYYGILKDIYPKNKLLWLVDRKVDHNEIAWRYHFPYSFDFHK